MYEVRYWTGSAGSNRWETFCVYGSIARDDAYKVANKLSELFGAVEIHITMTDGSLEIERV